MTAEDLLKLVVVGEKYDEHMNEMISNEILIRILERHPEYNIYLFKAIMAGSPEALLQICTLMKIQGMEQEVLKRLEEYHAQISWFIRNATHVLPTKEELEQSKNQSPWIGIDRIELQKDYYTLSTKLGNITLQKAAPLFKGTPSQAIFEQQLEHLCYKRSYEFIQQNPDYTAVLSYMPNIVYGGHYHVYLEKEEKVLDIAANNYYPSKEASNKVLKGRIIKRLSLEEIEGYYAEMTKKDPNINHLGEKLHILALRFDEENKRRL